MNEPSSIMEQISFKREIFRKIFHLGILIFPLVYYILGKWLSLMIFAPITLIVFLLDYYRVENSKIQFLFEKIFGNIMRSHEIKGEKLCGVTFTLFAVCIIFLIAKEPIVITSFAILAVSDSMAALIGRRFTSQPFFEKTLFGSIAFYVSGLIILFVCGLFYNLSLWFYLFGFFALFISTIIEARPSFLSIDDNFTIPVSFAVLMTVFDLMWNFI